jgi:hypothetical protein
VATLSKLTAALPTTVSEPLGAPARDRPEDLVARAAERRRARLRLLAATRREAGAHLGSVETVLVWVDTRPAF